MLSKSFLETPAKFIFPTAGVYTEVGDTSQYS
jgi:hypothetical protein